MFLSFIDSLQQLRHTGGDGGDDTNGGDDGYNEDGDGDDGSNGDGNGDGNSFFGGKSFFWIQEALT